MRLLRGSVQLQEDVALLDRLARLKIDLAQRCPASSALIMAPWTGEIEPTAVNIGCQSSCLTVALVTVVGGGTIFLPAEIMVKICKPLIPRDTRETVRRGRATTLEDRRLSGCGLGADEAEDAEWSGRCLVVTVCMGSSTEEKSPECSGDVELTFSLPGDGTA